MDLHQVGESVLSTAAIDSIKRIAKGLSTKAGNEVDPTLVQAQLEAYAREVALVRTLLSVESRVPIDRFFCPPRVRLGGKAFIAADSSAFYDNHVLVEGVAGQGKSSLLRHLCVTSILKHGRIALYYELRRLERLKSLETIIREDLSNIGLPAKEADLRHLAASRDLEIYLDGFDEIDRKQSMQIDRDITRLQRLNPHLKIFVSARPHAGMHASDVLTPLRIEKLNHRDVERLVEKISLSPELAKGLIERVRSHSGNALDLLETPLLVTLLVAQYAQTQQIPDQLSEFYDNIFPLLFERHDSFKVPFVRTRRLEVTNAVYRNVFQAFCYASLCVSPVSEQVALEVAKWAMSEVGASGKPEDFLSDISEISSLLVKDGDHWVFIHNSIQEFFAAQYLLSRQDADLEGSVAFLNKLPNQNAVSQVLGFARGLAPVKVTKFVEIPLLETKLEPISKGDHIDDELIKAWLRINVDRIAFDSNSDDAGRYFSLWMDGAGFNAIRCFALEAQLPELGSIIVPGAPVKEVLEKLLLWRVGPRLISEARKLVEPLLEQLNSCYEIVERDEGQSAASKRFLQDLIGKK